MFDGSGPGRGGSRDQRNLLLAIVLSVAILFGSQMLFGPFIPEPSEQPAPADQAGGTATVPGVGAPALPGEPAAPAIDPEVARQTSLEDTPRIPIETGLQGPISGSISLLGARFDDVVLNGYRETVEKDSPNITLLTPRGAPRAYFADFGWSGDGTAKVALPGADTLWRASGRALSPETPLTLSWDNGEGLAFSRRIEIDDEGLFTITQRVRNTGTSSVTLFPYGRISRDDPPETDVRVGMYVHEGPIAVRNGELVEAEYEDLREDGPTEVKSEGGGWIGIKDLYWVVALIPDQSTPLAMGFLYDESYQDGQRYWVHYLDERGHEIAPGGSVEVVSHMYAGAKERRVLVDIMEDLGVERFDMAIDYTRIWFLTIPLHVAILYLEDLLGHYGLAILALTVVVKLIFFPLANKSYKAMSKMKGLAPKMKELKEKYSDGTADSKLQLNKEMMALYKREKANPLAGCLPMLVQIPVFISLFIVFYVTIEMRHAPFFGWILDMSARDPTSMFNLFGLLPFTPPEFLLIGVWPLIMGGTMYLQQKLNPAPPDPIQAKVMMMLPFIFTFLFATFPAGLVIYWAWNNVLSIAQQYVIMRRMGVKI